MDDFRIRGVIDADSRRFQAALAGASSGLSRLRGEHAKTAASTRLLERETRLLNRELERQQRDLGVLLLQWRQLRFALMTAALRGAVTGFAALTNTVAALGSGIVMLTQQATKLGGALGAVGTAGLMAFGQGAVVAALGLKDLGKALTTTGKDHEKALEKLTKPARAFVGELRNVQIALREVRLIAQMGVFPGLTAGVKQAMPALASFKQVVWDTALVIGHLGERTGNLIGRRFKDLEAIGERNVVTLRRMGEGALALGEAFIDTFRAADPLVGHMTRGILTFTRNLRDAAAKARADGSLGHFFFELRKAWDSWTSTFGATAVGLFHVFRAANGPATAMADAINRAAKDFRDWTQTRTGQRQMTAFFESSNRTLGSMAKFMGALAASFARLSMAGGDNAVRFFDILRTTFIPLLEQMGMAFNRNLFPALLDMVESLGRFALAAAPGFETLGKLFAGLVRGIAGVLNVTRPFVASLPGISKAIAAFAIGSAIIFSWHKLRLAMELSILSLRRFLGLSSEIAIARPGLSMLFGGGGRNDAQQQAAQAGGSVVFGGRRGGGASGPPFIPASSRAGFQFASPGAAQQLLAWNREAERAARAGERLGRVAKQYAGPINTLTGLGQGIGILHTPHGDRAASTQQFVPGQRGVATPLPRRPTAAERDATLRAGGQGQHFVRTQGRVSLMADQAASIASATASGVGAGMRRARPLIAGAFGFAAVNGIVTALSSNSQGFGNRLRDALSGATFGLMKNSSERMGGNAQQLARNISQGQFGADFKTGIGPFSQRTKVGQFKLDTEGSRQAAKDFLTTLRDMGKIAEEDRVKLNRMVDEFGARLSRMGPQAAKLKGAIDQGLDLGGAEARVQTSVDRINQSFREMRRSGSGSMKQLKETVTTNAAVFAAELGRKSESGRLALAKNFRLAAAAVREQMQRGAVSTKEGTALIRKYLIDALVELGVPGGRRGAVRYLRDRDPLTNKPISGDGNPGGGKARGGWIQRLPGSVGPDSIPMAVNGQQIIAAPGEDVAVFTRHQRKVADRMMAPIGGLQGLFNSVRTKHNAYAEGGIVGGAPPRNAGSVVPLGRWLQSQGYMVGEHPAFGGVAPVHAHYGASDHYHGGSIDVNADGRPGGEPRWLDRIAGPIKQAGYLVLWRVKDHFDHLHASIGNAAASAIGKMADAMLGGGSAPRLGTAVSGLDGGVGAVSDAALKHVSAAAQQRLDSIAQTLGMGAGLETGGVGSVGKVGAGRAGVQALAQSMAAARGWTGASWAALHKLIMGESGYDTTARNRSSGAFGIGQFLGATKDAYASKGATSSDPARQLNAMYEYISDRYGGPQAAYSAWLSRNPHWYDVGGIIEASAGFLGADPPPRGSTPPNVNANDAVPPGSRGGGKDKPKAKKKPGRKPKPYTSGPASPNLAGVKGNAKRRQKTKPFKSKYAFLENLKDAAAQLAPIDRRYKGFEDSIENAKMVLSVLEAQQGLTNEEAVVTLFDSGSFADLSAFWAQNPELAAKYKDQLDSFDVVNSGGMMVQGKFVRGVNQHVGELLALMGIHTGSHDPSAEGGMLGQLLAYVNYISGSAIPRVAFLRDDAASVMAQIKAGWKWEHEEREEDRREIHKLTSGGRSWEQRVGDNNSRIKKLQDFKRQMREAAVGHKLTADAKRRIAKADQQIADLRENNTKLRDEKPPPRHDKENAKQRGSRQRRIASLVASRNDHARELDYLAGSREKFSWDAGLARDWKERFDSYTDHIEGDRSQLNRLSILDVPMERVEIARIAMEMQDWLGTSVPLPKLAEGQQSQDAERMNELLKAQNEELSKTLALSQSEKSVFEGFVPIMGRFAGSFARGGVIDGDAMALVHAHERLTVQPDPEGPFGSQISPRVNVAAPNVQLVVAGELAPLIRLIDQRVRMVAPGAVDRVTGRRSRSMTLAPGG